MSEDQENDMGDKKVDDDVSKGAAAATTTAGDAQAADATTETATPTATAAEAVAAVGSASSTDTADTPPPPPENTAQSAAASASTKSPPLLNRWNKWTTNMSSNNPKAAAVVSSLFRPKQQQNAQQGLETPNLTAGIKLVRSPWSFGSNHSAASGNAGAGRAAAPAPLVTTSLSPLQSAVLSPAASQEEEDDDDDKEEESPKEMKQDEAHVNVNQDAASSSLPSPLRRFHSDPTASVLAAAASSSPARSTSSNKKNNPTTTTTDTTTTSAIVASYSDESSLLSDDDDDDDDDLNSMTTDDYYSETASSSAAGSGHVTALQWAAAGLVDSVQQAKLGAGAAGYFRGRYDRAASLASPSTPRHSNKQQAQTKLLFNSQQHRASSDLTGTTTATTATSSPTGSSTKSNNNNNNNTTMARILNSPASQHLQQLQNSLDAAEYIMLLGRGMLGVNLKQSFKATEGVYVDFLVDGGAAQRSGVIYAGDAIHAVGFDGPNLRSKHGTIWTVPSMIAAAKRPVHLVLSTPRPGLPHKQHEPALPRISHVDVAIALLHHVVDQDAAMQRRQERQRQQQQPSDQDSLDGDDDAVSHSTTEEEEEKKERDRQDDDANHNNSSHSRSRSNRPTPQRRRRLVGRRSVGNEMELVTPPSFDTTDDDNDSAVGGGNANDQQQQRTMMSALVISLQDTVQAFVNPGLPPFRVRQAVQHQVAKRNNAVQFQEMPLDSLVQLAVSHQPLRHALRSAFLYCVMDGRRFSFLARHLALLDSTANDSPERRRRDRHSPRNTSRAHPTTMSRSSDEDDDEYYSSQPSPHVQQQQLPPPPDLAANSPVSATNSPTSTSSSSSITKSANAMLMLFLEMMNFTDLYGVTPAARRHEIASRIAHKYFLPTAVTVSGSSSSAIGNSKQQRRQELVPPMFDFHSMVTDSSLRALEAALKQQPAAVPCIIFEEFQRAVADALSAARPFCSFLISNECARMRAYLRNTAPYCNVPLHKVFDCLVSTQSPAQTSSPTTTAAAKNYFLYVLTYLFCLTDKEGFGEADDILAETAPTSAGGAGAAGGHAAAGAAVHHRGNRIEDAASGLCAALFLRTRVLPAVERVKQQQEEKEDGNDAAATSEEGVVDATTTTTATMVEEEAVHDLIRAFEQLWESFVAPGVGALSHRSQSGEVEEHLKRLMEGLQQVQQRTAHHGDGEDQMTVTTATTSENDNDIDTTNAWARLLTQDSLVHAARSLAEELLYEYASNLHSKFRAHKFHEWICDEFAKAATTTTTGVAPTTTTTLETSAETTTTTSSTAIEPEWLSDHPAAIPPLTAGCVKRLLRKTEWPVGITPHKPSHDVVLLRSSTTQSSTWDPEKNDDRANTPLHRSTTEQKEELRKEKLSSRCNAECAVVFGTAVGLDLGAQMPVPGMDERLMIRRYCCESTISPTTTSTAAENSHGRPPPLLSPLEIPSTLESYAIPPESSRATKPFEGYYSSGLQHRHHQGMMMLMENSGIAGWEASMVNFIVPRADVAASGDDGEDSALYGVSLVLRQQSRRNESPSSAKNALRLAGVRTAVADASGPAEAIPNDSTAAEASPLQTIKASVGSNPVFGKRLADRTWSARVASEVREQDVPAVIGLALVSQRNVMLAMRETLSLFFGAFARLSNGNNNDEHGIPPLVDLLGNFAYADVEPEMLLNILDPFLRTASAPWLERPIGAQKKAFQQAAGGQLVQSIPPIPLALLFVTALLEQKIVFSSSRRSVLLSATVALSELLKPLKWCHLMVPSVPANLAADLLQYPAPFILGMASEDPGIMDVIRDLPESVTLVDLDVGRVILAPSFAHDSELGRQQGGGGTTTTPTNNNNAEMAQALRSQVLFLAQSLGNVFGSVLDPELWLCDRAHHAAAAASMLSSSDQQTQPHGPLQKMHPFDALRCVCHDFVEELLAGTTSCCYWIEEARCDDAPGATSTTTKPEPTILFDEDRFFHVKNIRERDGFQPLLVRASPNAATAAAFLPQQSSSPRCSSGLALSVDNFDLVLELLLRCQSMNDYIGTRRREDMAFSI